MPIRGYGCTESKVSLPYLPIPVPSHIAVRRVGSRDEEEGLVALRRVVDEPVYLGCQYVRGVLASVAYRLVLVSLERAIQVLVGERIKEEVLPRSAADSKPDGPYRCGEPIDVRVEVVVNGVSVEELADVVRVVARRLKPHRKIIVVQALSHELGVSACLG